MRSRKVIIGKFYAIRKVYGIKILQFYQAGEGFDSEIKKIRNIRKIVDGRVLRKKLPHYRGIIICFKWGIIIYIKART